jgi:hypothetical protein
MNVEAISSSKMSVNFHQTTHSYISEDKTIYSHTALRYSRFGIGKFQKRLKLYCTKLKFRRDLCMSVLVSLFDSHLIHIHK